jgi:hypothetical protein
VALAVLILMISAGWGLHGVEGSNVDGPLLYTNAATFGFWVLWFMSLVILLPLIGRLWCTVCPVGWCNDLTARWGLKKNYPRKMHNFLAMSLALLLLSLLAELYSFNRYPDYTASLLAGVLLASIAAGLFFKGRIFCRFWCPIGGMAGIFSRISPLEVSSIDQDTCRRCESKACYHGISRWYRLTLSAWHTIFPFRRPGCPAFVFPPEAAGNGNCLMCTQCFKNCPYDNLRWGWRLPLSGLWRSKVRDRSESLLVIVLCGIAFYRLARFWGDLREVVDWPAVQAATHLPFVGPVAFSGIKLFSGFLLWPLLYFLLLALVAKMASESSLTAWPEGGEKTVGLLYDVAEIDSRAREEELGWQKRRRSLWGYLGVYSYAFLPLLAGAYGGFALIKLNEKLTYLPLVIGDPAGVRTYLAVHELHVASSPESLVSLVTARWAVVAMVASGATLSLWSTGRIGSSAYGEKSPAASRGTLVFRLGIVLLASLMLFCIKVWLFR